MSVLFRIACWQSPPTVRRNFIAAGIVGAVDLWVNAATQVTVLARIGLGGWRAHRLARPADAHRLPPESLAMLLRATDDLQVQPTAELLTLAESLAATDSAGSNR